MKKITFLIAGLLFNYYAMAQTTSVKAVYKKLPAHISYADSLISEFENNVYNSIYSPAFRSKSYMPTFTMLKIDIDKNGEIKDISFSDSADTLFVKTYLTMPKYDDDKSTLGKYAKAKSYKDISIIIPVSYEPFYSPKRSFYYDKMESLMKFNKKDFTGKAIILSPIYVGVLKEHNM